MNLFQEFMIEKVSLLRVVLRLIQNFNNSLILQQIGFNQMSKFTEPLVIKRKRPIFR